MSKKLTVLQVKLMFEALDKERTADSLPPPGSLSIILNQLVDKASSDMEKIDRKIASNFATAAIEMWHRAVHSFMISASLTRSSTIWSSVSGYYSSHYTMRAFAHLLGYFQLYSKKKVIRLEIDGSNYFCNIDKKAKDGKEHKFYWKVVKKHDFFVNDPIFTMNDESSPVSDCSHRNRANYADHINHFIQFQVLDQEYLTNRISKISSMEISDAPIPDTQSYPDIDNVQLIAYHRLVRFRLFMDEIFGENNRYWRVNRNPSWCNNYLDYQLVQPEYMNIYRGNI